MATTIKIRTSYAETVSKDYQSNRYGLDLECDVQLNGGDHRIEVETAAATLFNFSKAIVAKQKESGFAVNDLFNGTTLPATQELQHHANANVTAPSRPQNGNGGSALCSAKQVAYIRTLCRGKKVPEQVAREHFNKDNLNELTAKEASQLIEGLKP
ncbi:MAG: hypothetical protein JNL74_04715 [Fibrobacteres bacterium]|nr:hypothetical protein [Fibrobacterota bacterium]